LVAEGLHEAASFQLDDTLVIASAPCSAKVYEYGEFPRPYSYTLRAALGDHFSAPLPDSPPFSARRVSGIGISGHWPADVWLMYGFLRVDAGAEEQFHQWDGSRWNTFETAPFNVVRREPHRIFDWFDGAKLVAQARHWHDSISYHIEPFLLWGKTTHPAPDFSGVQFPWYREDQNVRIYYDVSPTHEVFVTHVLTKERPDRTVVTIARASATGEVRSETVLDTPGFADARIALGRWGEREVAIAWGDTLVSVSSGQVRRWVRLFDGASWIPFVVPGPPLSQDHLTRLWLADGRIWARSGDVLWQFSEKKWVDHIHIAQSAILSEVLPGGAIWAVDGATLIQFDEKGRSRKVPFVDNPPSSLQLAGVSALGVDDIWIRASDAANEQLFFRTRSMQLVSCD
jgi:hypothetical protein